jgi:hypothetical protein
MWQCAAWQLPLCPAGAIHRQTKINTSPIETGPTGEWLHQIARHVKQKAPNEINAVKPQAVSFHTGFVLWSTVWNKVFKRAETRH